MKNTLIVLRTLPIIAALVGACSAVNKNVTPIDDAPRAGVHRAVVAHKWYTPEIEQLAGVENGQSRYTTLQRGSYNVLFDVAITDRDDDDNALMVMSVTKQEFDKLHEDEKVYVNVQPKLVIVNIQGS